MPTPTNTIRRDITLLEHGVGPSSWCFWDDFNDFNMSETSALAKWTKYEEGASTQLLDLTTTGGALILTQNAGDAETISLIANSGIKISDLMAGESIYFGCRFKTTDADDTHVHIGLGIHDTDYIDGVPADHIVFQLVEGAATLNLNIVKDSTETASDGIATLADDTYCRVFFEYVPSSTTDIGDVKYVAHSGGTRSHGTVAAAGNFPDDVVIFPVIQMETGAAAADTLTIDWIYAYAARSSFTDGTG